MSGVLDIIGLVTLSCAAAKGEGHHEDADLPKSGHAYVAIDNTAIVADKSTSAL